MSIILNPFVFGVVVTATWNPAVVSPAAVLSVANTRLTANTGAAGMYAATRSTRAIQGLCYFSAEMSKDIASGSTYGFGISDATKDFTPGSAWIGDATTGVGVWGPSGIVFQNGADTGLSVGTFGGIDTAQIAIRVATRRVWIRRAGGAWAGGGDPVADTTPTATLTGSGALYVVGTVTKAGANASRYVELDIDAASTTGTVPSGFIAANWVP